MALLYPKIPCVTVNTGGNYPEAWKTIHQLQKKGIKTIVLSSFQGGYPTYYDYLVAGDHIPYIVSCSYRAKQMHLNRFYKTIAPVTVNIGLTVDEEERTENFSSDNSIKYNFPLIEHGYTRELCAKVLKRYDVEAKKSGCWFCGKQPNASWDRLREDHPKKYEECLQRGWYP